MYFDALASQGVSQEWGITGVGLHNRQMKAALSKQDCLYTVVERGTGVERGRVVGSLCEYRYAPDESSEVRAALADERTRLVTLTITGNGYHFDPHCGEFDTECEAVRADQGADGQYQTAWGFLADALESRRRSGTKGFTVLSCDNMPDNGGAARAAMVTFARMRDPGLAHWIEENVAFPSTMVDRITPATSQIDRDFIERRFGVADRWPVVTEPFSQWIIEDNFCNGRPPLEDVGVEIVADVSTHKLVKTRLLNGVHCAIGYLGILAGYERTAEAMADPLIYGYVQTLMRSEIAPLLPAVPGWDMDDYQRALLRRLTNPHISDQLSRLAARGSTKMPSYLLPSLNEARTQRRQHTLLTIAVAAWLRYLRAYDFTGAPITIQDQHAPRLTELAERGHNDARPLLGLRDIFANLSEDVAFTSRVSAMLEEIDRFGVRAALQRNATGSLTGAMAR
jgi:mannitol-1-phosphate/altronate dehydrogenase